MQELKRADLLKHLGDSLREARRMRHMTQLQVARRAGLDVRYYSRIELGRVNVTYATLSKVSAALKVFPLILHFFATHPAPAKNLEVIELVTHLFSTGQRKKVSQLLDFVTRILGVKCNCQEGHCPTVRILRQGAPRGGRGRGVRGYPLAEAGR